MNERRPDGLKRFTSCILQANYSERMVCWLWMAIPPFGETHSLLLKYMRFWQFWSEGGQLVFATPVQNSSKLTARPWLVGCLIHLAMWYHFKLGKGFGRPFLVQPRLQQLRGYSTAQLARKGRCPTVAHACLQPPVESEEIWTVSFHAWHNKSWPYPSTLLAGGAPKHVSTGHLI